MLLKSSVRPRKDKFCKLSQEEVTGDPEYLDIWLMYKRDIKKQKINHLLASVFTLSLLAKKKKKKRTQMPCSDFFSPHI